MMTLTQQPQLGASRIALADAEPSAPRISSAAPVSPPPAPKSIAPSSADTRPPSTSFCIPKTGPTWRSRT